MADETTDSKKNPLQQFWDGLFGGGIGNIFSFAFWGLALAGIAFFVLKSFPGLAEKIPGEWKAGIESFLTGINPALSLFPEAMEEYLGGLDATQKNAKGEASAREMLTKKLGEEAAPLVNVITENNDVWKDFLKLVKEANGGLSEKAFLSDKTIYAMLTQKPDMARKLVDAMPRPEAGKPMSATTQKVMDAVKAIVATPDRLNVLLTNDTQLNILTSAIARVAPITLSADGPAAMATLIRTVGIKDGKATPEFTAFLNTLLSSSDVKTTTDALVSFLMRPEAQAHTKEVSAFLMTLDVESITDAGLKEMVKLAQNEQNLTALLTLKTSLDALGAGKTDAVIAALNSGNNAEILRLAAADPAIKAALTAFRDQSVNLPEKWKSGLDVIAAGTSDSLAATAVIVETAQQNNVDLPALSEKVMVTKDGKKTISVDALFDLCMNADNLNLLAAPGVLKSIGAMISAQVATTTDPKEKEGLAFLATQKNGAYVNLLALDHFMVAVANKINNAKTPADQKESMKKVAKAFMQYALGDPKALDGLTGKEVAQFFGDPTNRAAADRLLAEIDPSALPQKERDILTALKNNRNGILTVMSDPEGAATLLDSMRGKGGNRADLYKNDWEINTFGFNVDESIKTNLPALRAVDVAVNGPPPRTPCQGNVFQCGISPL